MTYIARRQRLMGASGPRGGANAGRRAFLPLNNATPVSPARQSRYPGPLAGRPDGARFRINVL